MAVIDNTLERIIQKLAEKLPSGWQILDVRAEGNTADAILKFRAPRGKTGSVLVQVKRRLEPKDVDFLAATTRSAQKLSVLIVAPFISARTQQRLRAGGLGYADLTGNIHLSIPEPGLLIETTGAEQSPVRTPRERKSLKGAKAGRLIRALCDFRPPIGIRELAKRTGIDAGYASRLIDYLDREALITRQGRGPIASTDWAGLLQRWAQEYTPFERVSWFLAPRGITQTLQALRSVPSRYAMSGSWAAAQFAPVSPTRLLLCYADDMPGVARALDIRPADAGANVALAPPFDPVVYERTLQKGGITVTAPSQIVADLLTSPGRGPNEADALLQWMRENENAWRS